MFTFKFAAIFGLIRTVSALAATFGLIALTGCQSSGVSGEQTKTTNRTESTSEVVPFGELEGILDVQALKWVEEQNKVSKVRLGTGAAFEALKSDILAIIQAKDRIPAITIVGSGANARVRNFWQDAAHVKGIYREQSLAAYRKQSDKWETLIDVDALAAKEKESWVFKGVDCIPGDANRCLLSLSRGGGDAVVVREYDMKLRDFVAGGFSFPEGKVRLDWLDADRLWAGLPLGPDTVSDSGYPITVRLLKRGDDPAKVAVLFRGDKTDVSVDGFTMRSITDKGTRSIDMITHGITFFDHEYLVQQPGGSWRKLPLPLDTQLLGLVGDRLLFRLQKSQAVLGSDLEAGAIYAFNVDDWKTGKTVAIETVFQPNERQAVSYVSFARGRTLLVYLDNVRSRIADLSRKGGKWSLKDLKLPGKDGVAGIGFADYDEKYFTFSYSDMLTPSQLWLVGADAASVRVRTTPARFDAKGMKVEMREATSRDGTKVPYFVAWPKNAKLDGANPTLMYAYGGFDIPMTPGYLSTVGKVWSERGGVYVLANIRGGGEFGPRWHLGALKEKRQNAYDDLFAVAEDLIRTKVTSAQHLGVRGGSNGGLMAGVALTQRPDLFGAVLSSVPLLDMLRFHKLLAGASWMGEYGNPDIPEERAFLEKYSPFQNLKEGTKYPEAFFTTSTRDDRVHPGHARRMVAKMMAMKLPVLYFENTEGGHAGAATLDSRAGLQALEYNYLWQKLGSEKLGVRP